MKSNNFTYLDCASLWPSYILSVRDPIQTILDLKLNREALENPQKKKKQIWQKVSEPALWTADPIPFRQVRSISVRYISLYGPLP